MCVGSQEELLTQKIAELHSENCEKLESTRRSTPNSNVTTFRRDKQPLRQEVIDSSSNFLQVISYLVVCTLFIFTSTVIMQFILSIIPYGIVYYYLGN